VKDDWITCAESADVVRGIVLFQFIGAELIKKCSVFRNCSKLKIMIKNYDRPSFSRPIAVTGAKVGKDNESMIVCN
jgi:hypothetical protein